MSMIDLPVSSAVLAEVLQKRNVGAREIEGSLVEFVMRAWKDGRTVREWCKDVQQVLDVVKISETIRGVILSKAISLLIPFVSLPSEEYFPSTEPPLPPSLVSAETLSSITRPQLVHALAELDLRNQAEGSRPFCDEPLIHELCLSSDSVDPVNSLSDLEDVAQSSSTVSAWVDRRLSIGISYLTIIEKLRALRTKVGEIEGHSCIDAILDAKFGALSNCLNEGLSTEQTGLLWSSPRATADTSADVNRSFLLEPEDLYSQLTSPSRTSLLSVKMGRKRSLTSRAPKWLHFGQSSIPEGSTNDLTSPSTVNPTFPPTANTFRQIFMPMHDGLTTPSMTFKDDLRSSLMSLTDTEDIRAVLLNQLMEMRYHLHGHEDEGWFLGGGREQAEESLLHLIQKMIGKKDLMGLKGIFTSMRSAFDLPPPIDGASRPTTILSVTQNDDKSMLETPIPRTSSDLDRFLDEVAKLPDTLHECSSGETEIGHSRQEVSGEVDTPDLHECEPNCAESSLVDPLATNNLHLRPKSGSAHSILTMTSLLTAESQEETRLSCFEIQEAYREYQAGSKAVQYHFPLPPSTPPSASSRNSTKDVTADSMTSASSPSLDQRDGRYTRLPSEIVSPRRIRENNTMGDDPQEAENADFAICDLESGLQDQEEIEIVEAYSTIETLSPKSPSSISDADSPSRSTFDTHIVTPTTIRYPYTLNKDDPSLSTLSSQATLYSPHETPSYSISSTRRRTSLGPTDKSRRQIHRHYAIFEGKVSPTKELRALGIDVPPNMDAQDIDALDLGVLHLSVDSEEARSQSSCKPQEKVELEDITPKVSVKRRSKVLRIPKKKLSFIGRPKELDIAYRSRALDWGKGTPPRTPVPLQEVLSLFREHGMGSDISLARVEHHLTRIIGTERFRVEKAGQAWDEEKKGRLRWLIEQVAVILGDPIYVAPISRVVASLSATGNHSSDLSLQARTDKSHISQLAAMNKRPSLSRYKSQPSLPMQMQFTSSFLSSPPRPEAVRPNILRRHTQQCLSITSLESAPSMYSLPSADGEEDEEIINTHPHMHTDFPSPTIGGFLIAPRSNSAERENTIKRNIRISKGYEEWDIPMPQRLEWPVASPHKPDPQSPPQPGHHAYGNGDAGKRYSGSHSESESRSGTESQSEGRRSVGSTGTFGRV
uniref:Uncharacterized protein n=1 Tax=Kwoniella dejecticola CBS 10117 TaxID=1296121 RepID=A0A1A5ZZM2_9TREE|nr:uncharacterized protein I303_06824 [Kwoniella dejecticola CBS 10117]OBR83261.1 hypothetical protein I303_06824 [Kwoniella dejecticola CBS 10117]